MLPETKRETCHVGKHIGGQTRTIEVSELFRLNPEAIIGVTSQESLWRSRGIESDDSVETGSDSRDRCRF